MYHILILTTLFITASPPALRLENRSREATASFAGDRAQSPALHGHLKARQPEGSQQ